VEEPRQTRRSVVSAIETGLRELPDPRRYGAGDTHHPFNQLTEHELRCELSTALSARRDDEIHAALRAAPSREAYAQLWPAVCDAAHHAGSEASEAAVVARIFALPLVIITGSRRPASLPGVIPDIIAVKTLLEKHGALGRTLNFGLSNALCSLETIEQVKPSEIYAWAATAEGVRRELAPAAIELTEPGERVHLRFLVGAGIAPASEPSIVETASNIGAWGMALTRALAAQLGQPGIEVLPLARAPIDLLRAGHAGRVAQLDTAFSLFVSNAVRRFRSATGDPVAVISAHDDSEIRVSFSSLFDDSMVEGFRWPLHPLDGIDSIVASITSLLDECRITDVRCASALLPPLNAHGQTWYVTAREANAVQTIPLCH